MVNHFDELDLKFVPEQQKNKKLKKLERFSRQTFVKIFGNFVAKIIVQ